MVFQLALGFIDQVIVGTLGGVAIAAVGLSNSAIAIGNLTLATLGTGTAILVARAYGGGQHNAIARISGAALVVLTALALLLALPFAVFARQFLSGIGAAPEIVSAGQAYFRIAVLTVPLAVVSAVASATLRALGRARAPMATTMLAVVLNTLVGYLLVFGLGPIPSLGVAGAAWATFAAQAVKVGALLQHLYGRRSPAGWDLPHTAAEWRFTSRALLQFTLPLTLK